MAGITIQQVKASYRLMPTGSGGGYDTNWYDFTGSSDNYAVQTWRQMLAYTTPTATNNYAGVYVYKCALDMQANSKVTSARITTNLVSQSYYNNVQEATFKCYLYDVDPYTIRSSSTPLYPPDGYLGTTSVMLHWDVAPRNTYVAKRQSFTITGLDIRSNKTLYFWICVEPVTTYTSLFLQSMNGGNVTVATAEAGVTFEKIPTSLTLSPGNVTTGNAVSLTIGNYRPTETVKFYYNTTLLDSVSVTNGSTSVTCPKTWFDTAGITTSNVMTVTVKVDDTTLEQTLTLTAGDDTRPTVGAPTMTLVQASSASSFPDTYIANLSRAKVEAAVTLATNAAIDTVILSTPGIEDTTMEYNALTGKYEGTSPPVPGNTIFTVTATDLRGMAGTNTIELTDVMMYVLPSVQISDVYTYRCDQNGQKEEGGAYVTVYATETHYTALEGNTLQVFRFYVEEDPLHGDDLVSGVGSAPTPFVSRDNSGTVVVEIQDQLSGIIQKRLKLPSRHRNFVMKRSNAGTYAAFGMAPTRTTGLSSVELPPGGEYLIGGISALALTHLPSAAQDGTQFSKDFLQIDEDVLYAAENADSFFIMSSSAGWNNYPAARSTGWSGLRSVVWIDGTHILVKVLEFSPTPGDQWINFYDGSTWNGWRHIASTL